MRGVRVQGSLLAAGCAAAILVFTGAPAAAEEQAALSPENGLAAPSQDDYYTRRAKHTLEAERRAVAKPHPLAVGYPGMDVVVCEAGCPDGRSAHVVSVRRHVEPTVTSEGYMMTTAAEAAGAQDGLSTSADVACIAGCYGAMDEQPSPRSPPVPRAERMELPPRDPLSPVR